MIARSWKLLPALLILIGGTIKASLKVVVLKSLKNLSCHSCGYKIESFVGSFNFDYQDSLLIMIILVQNDELITKHKGSLQHFFSSFLN